MTAREYLGQLKVKEIRLERKKSLLDEIKAKSLIPAVSYAERVQTSVKKEAPFEKTFETFESLRKESEEEMANFWKLKSEIVKQISGLEEAKSIQILYKRYVEYKPYKIIALECNYTCAYVRKLSRDALKEFAEKYGYEII